MVGNRGQQCGDIMNLLVTKLENIAFGTVPGTMICVEKVFKVGDHKYEEYNKGVRFGDGDCALVVDVCLHRVDEDTSGLTFEEWDPSTDTDDSQDPVAMIVNSSEVCASTSE